MSVDVCQRAFEPFFTTKPAGSGLGLSMVYGFVGIVTRFRLAVLLAARYPRQCRKSAIAGIGSPAALAIGAYLRLVWSQSPSVQGLRGDRRKFDRLVTARIRSTHDPADRKSMISVRNIMSQTLCAPRDVPRREFPVAAASHCQGNQRQHIGPLPNRHLRALRREETRLLRPVRFLQPRQAASRANRFTSPLRQYVVRLLVYSAFFGLG
jgi:hypothetical protein